MKSSHGASFMAALVNTMLELLCDRVEPCLHLVLFASHTLNLLLGGGSLCLFQLDEGTLKMFQEPRQRSPAPWIERFSDVSDVLRSLNSEFVNQVYAQLHD